MIMGFVLLGQTNLSAASQQEIDALMALYNSTDGDNWTNNTYPWGVGDPCTVYWSGVYCNAENNVDNISLSNTLTGSIPPEIGNLVNLTRLALYSNDNLTGSIPPEIGNLVNLTDLSLHGNNLTGSIPTEIGNLVNLTKLSLSSNDLTGSIPTEIGNLVNLTELHLNSNDLTGSIPPEIGNLVSLTDLHLGWNELTRSIPTEIGNLVNLTELHLNYNNFSGSIPTEIGNLVSLTALSLNHNYLFGSIPPEIRNLVNLDASSTKPLTLNNNSYLYTNDIATQDFIDIYAISYWYVTYSNTNPPTNIALDSTIFGTWDVNSSAIHNSSYTQESLAKFHSFTMDTAGPVYITLDSQDDTYFYVFPETNSSNVLYSSVGGGLSYVYLNAGTYMMEVTTRTPLETGEFEFSINTTLPGEEPLPDHTTCPTIDIDLNSTTIGTWDMTGEDICVSSHQSDSYARFYTFTLDSTELVYITLESVIDTHFYLLPDTNQTSTPIYDDFGNSPTGIELDAGTYTIEATTYDPNEVEDFSLSLTTYVTEPEPEPTICPSSNINLNSTINGTWDVDCDSISRSGSFAKYYTFVVTDTQTVKINLNSVLDTYLYLHSGTDQSLTPITENDDFNGLLTSEIEVELPAGTYTIEATTFGAGITGDFDLSLSASAKNIPPAIIMYLLN